MRRFYTIIGHATKREPVWIISHIGRYVTEREIIIEGREVCQEQGGTLSEVAGIPWTAIGEGAKRIAVPARPFKAGEEFDAALSVLNSSGHTYRIFDSADPDEVDTFIQEATSIGFRDDALDLVENTQHDL